MKNLNYSNKFELKKSNREMFRFFVIIFKYVTEMFTCPFSILFKFCLSLSHNLASSDCVIPFFSLISLILNPTLIINSLSFSKLTSAIN